MTTKPSLEIRFAQPHDVANIYRFILELARFEKLEHEVCGTELDLHNSLFGEKPTCEAVLARLDDQPVGFALFFHNYSTFLARKGLYLEDLYVSPEARGFGVGKALLKFLAKTAVDRGCGRFEWWVLDWNVKAIEFYKSLGAEPMDQWTVFRVDGASLTQLAQTP